MYYWYGNPYSLEVVLKDWNGNEEKDNTYRPVSYTHLTLPTNREV